MCSARLCKSARRAPGVRAVQCLEQRLGKHRPQQALAFVPRLLEWRARIVERAAEAVPCGPFIEDKRGRQTRARARTTAAHAFGELAVAEALQLRAQLGELG